jgi:hypothetical protein
VIEISHMSGMSNVKYWLAEHGYDTGDEALCQRVFELAKTSGHTLTADEIHACRRDAGAGRGRPE